MVGDPLLRLEAQMTHLFWTGDDPPAGTIPPSVPKRGGGVSLSLDSWSWRLRGGILESRILGSMGSVPGEELLFSGFLLLMPDFSVGRFFCTATEPLGDRRFCPLADLGYLTSPRLSSYFCYPWGWALSR